MAERTERSLQQLPLSTTGVGGTEPSGERLLQPLCHALPQHRTSRPNADHLGRHIYTFMTGQGLSGLEDNCKEEIERILHR